MAHECNITYSHVQAQYDVLAQCVVTMQNEKLLQYDILVLCDKSIECDVVLLFIECYKLPAI